MRWSCHQMNPDLNNVLIFLNLTHLCTTHSMDAFRVSDALMYVRKKVMFDDLPPKTMYRVKCGAWRSTCGPDEGPVAGRDQVGTLLALAPNYQHNLPLPNVQGGKHDRPACRQCRETHVQHGQRNTAHCSSAA